MSTVNDGSIPPSEAKKAQSEEAHPITNMEKYENYKNQFQRLKKAMDNHFYLEAIFIEYAIIEDRTTSILAYEGNNRRKCDNMKLQEKLDKIKNCANYSTPLRPWIGRYFSDDNSNKLIDRIIAWKDYQRNRPTHRLMKIIVTTEELSTYAENGKALCKELSHRANNYRHMVERKNKAQSAAPEMPKKAPRKR